MPEYQGTIAQMACFSGRVEILKYVIEKGALVHKSLCKTAVSVKALECFRYLHEIGSYWDADVIRSALQFNSHECLKYAIDHGCPRDESSIHMAINCGNLLVLKQLDLDFDYHSMDSNNILCLAARSGSVACLKYLIEEKRVLVERGNSLVRLAQMYGHQECIAYLQQLPSITEDIQHDLNYQTNT